MSTEQADRIESFLSAIDTYEPTLEEHQHDAFRMFARFVSRSIDRRYLERHPIPELLPDLERFLQAIFVREGEDILAKLLPADVANPRRIVLVTAMPDQVFIFRTVQLAIERLGLKAARWLNVMVPVRRSVTGEISAIGPQDAVKESFIWIELDVPNVPDVAKQAGAIASEVHRSLMASRKVVADFPRIHTLVRQLIADFEKRASAPGSHQLVSSDNARLLDWLLDDHFVFLGTRFLPAGKGQRPEALGDFGVCGFSAKGAQGDGQPLDFRAHIEPGAPFLWIRKGHESAWIYRPGHLDNIIVQCLDESGTAAGFVLIEGLFNYPALSVPRTEIPLLDRMIEEIYLELGADRGSHKYRSLRNAFNSLPLEYLFCMSTAEVAGMLQQVLAVENEERLQVHVSTDTLQAFAFVIVALPRTHYSNEIRTDVRDALKAAMQARSVDDGVYVGNVESVVLHFFFTGARPLDADATRTIEAQIEQVARPWFDKLVEELRRRKPLAEARRLQGLYSEAFGRSYREATSVARAVSDIELLEELVGERTFDCDIYREAEDRHVGITRLRTYSLKPLKLSDILPVLDNFGLIVMDQRPSEVTLPGRPKLYLGTFRIEGVVDAEVDLVSRRNRLTAAIRAVMSGAMSNEVLNRLLLRSDIAWTYVSLIRAYELYGRQLGFHYGNNTVQDALLRHADIVRALTELFRAKFDPDIAGLAATVVDDKRQAVVERAARNVQLLLEAVDDLQSDRVLRTFLRLIEATVRTSFYARDAAVLPSIVLKLDPSCIEGIPKPVPYREICVHHPQVRGVHLRGGPVARGGLRWSDRPVDFRTEVLGLMATQGLKNVLIAPKGAKGGFVLRRPPADAKERRELADRMYRVFVGGLLSVTDNLVEGKIRRPERVLAYDGDDHYLVVAADKGTGHLSDAANAVAMAQGFWLHDAFASGGSSGYDHKKEAITARGVWECTKRHFREIGINPESDPITVCGIGDMSGDVFGNGVLCSKTMQLVAAFDHRHIFLDPAPDPVKSFQARLALFHKGPSSWDDYPKEFLSAGGGVYPRGAKSIRLSPQVRTLLGITQEELSGLDLVRAVLMMPVDLLWNGGIGTYIKASEETHLDVGDPSNDTVRVDAQSVRATVLAEGGNLGVTARARVELAAAGVRLNSDAIDNSGGVDLSDHEVNLKILLALAMQAGLLTLAERNSVLESVKEDVKRDVLRNNGLHGRMLSLDVLRSQRDLPRFARAITFLGERMGFSAREARLPDRETLKERAAGKFGLYRPELAILCAQAKLFVREELQKSQAPLLDTEDLRRELVRYFPVRVVERFGAQLLAHPLAHDIAGTVWTNSLVADVGCSWFSELLLGAGNVTTSSLVHAYERASWVLGAGALKTAVDQAEQSMDAVAEYQLRLAIEQGLEELTHWELGRITPAHEHFAKAFAEAWRSLHEFLTDADVKHLEQSTFSLRKAHIPGPLAAETALLDFVSDILGIAETAVVSGHGVDRCARTYLQTQEAWGAQALLRRPVWSMTAADDELEGPAVLTLRHRLRRLLIQKAQAAVSYDTVARPAAAPWRDDSARTPRQVVTRLVLLCDRMEREVGGR